MPMKGGAHRRLKDKALLTMNGPDWAWEFLRRIPEYCDKAAGAEIPFPTFDREASLTIIEDDSAHHAEAWGLCAFANPRLSASQTPVTWHPRLLSGALPVLAKTCATGIDFRRLGLTVTVTKGKPGDEHVVLRDKAHSLQLHVLEGSILDGPVELTFHVEGLESARQKVTALDRLLIFLRKGQLPPSPLPQLRTAQRWLLALKALPLVQAGFTDREVANKLFPQHATPNWNDSNDWLRTQIRRARIFGLAMTSGDYRRLVSWENS